MNTKLSHSIMLFKEFLRTPQNIGAICPSSVFLSRAVCSMLPRARKGLVLEVGAGTGALTRGLAYATKPEELLLLERSPRLSSFLHQVYPRHTVINADALELDRHLPEGRKVAAIVSSMPLLTIPDEYRRRILQQFRQALGRGGRLLLISYNMFCNQDIVDAGFVSKYHKIVVPNIPPARIDCFIPV